MSHFKPNDEALASLPDGKVRYGTLIAQWTSSGNQGWVMELDGGQRVNVLESDLTLKYRPNPAYTDYGGGLVVQNDLPGTKYDAGKSRVDLIPARELLQIGDVLAFGATRYSPDNWKKVPDGRARYLAATLRHIYAHMSGEKTDSAPYPDGSPGSGLSHLAHAATSILFLMHFENEANK